MSGEDGRHLGYRGQIEAESIDLALLKFLRKEKARVTHIRTRPGCRIAFREGVHYFYFVYEHGVDPKLLKG